MKINYFKIFNIHNYYIISCSIYILLYIFITPPFYVADEYAHFQKSVSNENIYLRGPLNIDTGIKNFADDFEKLAYNKWKIDRKNKYSKKFISENYNKYKLENKSDSANLSSLSGYPVSGYIVSKSINYLSKNLTNNVFFIFYSGRIANFVFCMIVCWLTIKTIPKGKNYLFTILSMPMTLTLFGSYNQDAILFSYTLLIIFFTTKILNNKGPKELYLFLIQLFCFFLVLGRPTYMPFFILPLVLILKFSEKKFIQNIIFLTYIILTFLFIYTYVTPAPSNPITLPGDLFKIFILIINDFNAHILKYLALMIGGLGRIDLIINDFLIIFIFLCIIFFLFSEINFRDIFSKFNISICFIFVSTFVFTQVA